MSDVLRATAGEFGSMGSPLPGTTQPWQHQRPSACTHLRDVLHGGMHLQESVPHGSQPLALAGRPSTRLARQQLRQARAGKLGGGTAVGTVPVKHTRKSLVLQPPKVLNHNRVVLRSGQQGSGR